jgi:prephenate dehydrogenase
MMIARMITSQDLHELLAEHDKRYDLVIVAATFDQTLNVVRSFAKHSPFIVLLAKPAATLKNILEAVKLISPPNAVVSFCK